eukprot:COSAG01_NODE_5364_length_4308_cov_3.542647_4_plen_100_part_00
MGTGYYCTACQRWPTYHAAAAVRARAPRPPLPAGGACTSAILPSLSLCGPTHVWKTLLPARRSWLRPGGWLCMRMGAHGRRSSAPVAICLCLSHCHPWA